MTIKFMKHYVTNGEIKARVHYSHFVHASLDVQCVSLYEKDYNHNLRGIFPNKSENNSDILTDYFEKDRVLFFEGDPHYNAALARCS